jgi:hypothetical protein
MCEESAIEKPKVGDEYHPCMVCGVDCDFLGTSEVPCQGQVKAVEEEQQGDGSWEWVHACEVHARLYGYR